MENQNKPVRKFVKEKLIVDFKNESYDLTKFILKHPGGVNTLNQNYKNFERIFYEFDHSKAAEHLLEEYRIKSIKNKSIEVSFFLCGITN